MLLADVANIAALLCAAVLPAPRVRRPPAPRRHRRADAVRRHRGGGRARGGRDPRAPPMWSSTAPRRRIGAPGRPGSFPTPSRAWPCCPRSCSCSRTPRAGGGRPCPLGALAEALLLAVALAATCAIAFLPPKGGGWYSAPCLLPRRCPCSSGRRCASAPEARASPSTAVAIAAIAARRPRHRTLPDLVSRRERAHACQMFVLLTTLPVLCIAAVDSARQEVLQLYHALLASLHDHVAILDARGVVLRVNDSWRRFASAADGRVLHGVGPADDYLAACRSAATSGDVVAERALAGLTSVLRRDQRRFELEFDRDGGQSAYTITVEALESGPTGAVVTRTDRHRRAARRSWRSKSSGVSCPASRGRRCSGPASGALAHELNQRPWRPSSATRTRPATPGSATLSTSCGAARDHPGHRRRGPARGRDHQALACVLPAWGDPTADRPCQGSGARGPGAGPHGADHAPRRPDGLRWNPIFLPCGETECSCSRCC